LGVKEIGKESRDHRRLSESGRLVATSDGGRTKYKTPEQRITIHSISPVFFKIVGFVIVHTAKAMNVNSASVWVWKT
jgi:hypothetical protein